MGSSKLVYLYLFVIVIGLPTIILFAYKMLYSTYVNKKLQNQSYNSDYRGGRIPDSHTGVKIIAFLIILGTLSSQKSMISDVKQTQRNQYYQNEEMEERLDEINKRINEIRKIEKKQSKPQSMISRVDVSYGALKDDHETASVTFYISLLNLEKDFNYYLVYGDEKNQITLKESKKGVLEGVAELNIFKTYSNITFVKEDKNGNTVSEEITPNENWSEELTDVMGWIADEYGEELDEEDADYEGLGIYYYYICQISPRTSTSESKNNVHCKVKLNVLEPEVNDGSYKIVKGTLCIEENGKIKEQNIDLEDLFTDKGYTYDYKNKNLKDKNVSIYFVFEDSYGLTHKRILWARGEDEDQMDEDEEYGPTIYKDGERMN